VPFGAIIHEFPDENERRRIPMGKKILIIDDDPVIVRYLEALFQDRGYETVVARDGLEAYEKVKAETPDLITLDLQMPEEWGNRFYRRLSKEKDFADIPVIVISGLAGRHLAIRKVVANFQKPFDPEELMAVVRNTIGEAA
jgi:DNA-binding response OmpR family regulator